MAGGIVDVRMLENGPYHVVLVYLSQVVDGTRAQKPRTASRVQRDSAQGNRRPRTEFSQDSSQSEDGTFSSQVGPGVTALVLTSMLRNDVPLTDAALAKGLKALEGFVKPMVASTGTAD